MCCGGGGDWEPKLSTCLHGPTSSRRPSQPLTSHSFSTVKPPAPRNLTVHADISHTWLLTWNNPYPSDNLLYSELTYLVNISNENDPTDVSGCPLGFLCDQLVLGWVETQTLGCEMGRVAPTWTWPVMALFRDQSSHLAKAPGSQCADREFIFRHGSSSIKEELWTPSVSQGWGTWDFRRYLCCC